MRNPDSMRQTIVVALVAVALMAALAVPAHAYQTALCVPGTGRPAVSAAAAGTEAAAQAFRVTVRHAGAPSAVTVRVRVQYSDGTSYSDTVAVPTTPVASVGGSTSERRTTGMLSVPRRTGDQTIAITITDHHTYGVCIRHAGVVYAGVNRRVPPPPPTTLPDIEPVIEQDPYPRPEPAERPTNPDGTPNLYGPGGTNTDEKRLEWKCWAAFGNTEILREHGFLSDTESC